MTYPLPPLLAEATTGEAVGAVAVAVVTAVGGYFVHWWKRNDANRDRAEAKADKQEAGVIKELRENIKELRETLKKHEARGDRQEQEIQAAETHRHDCEKTLERYAARIGYLEEALDNAKISYRKANLAAPGSGIHLPIVGDRRHSPDPNPDYHGPERRSHHEET
jgi:septal ring factor EnvC (AmiA/AmiB activator)